MSTVQIWDKEDLPSELSLKKFILWNSYSFDSIYISIPELVDQNEKILRSKFLAWNYELSQLTLDNQTLAEALVLKNSISFWWLTNLSEKCNFSKSPEIDNIIKLFALELYSEKNPIDILELNSSNHALCNALEIWCENKGITFIKLETKKLIQLRSLIPQNLKALVWFAIHLFKRRALFGLNLDKWKKSSKKITFFSYFSNLKPSDLKDSKYGSRFWGDLPKKISSRGIQSNWLHIYLESALLPNASTAAEAIKKITDSSQNELHVTLDTFMSFRLIARVLKDWLFIQRIGRKFFFLFSSQGPNSQLLILDWKKTFHGIDGLKHILMHHQLLESQRNLPKQRVGFYLQEFQAWEVSLLDAWKSYSKNNNIIAVPHSTIRFWDLRNFNDPRCFEGSLNTSMPIPGHIALNGMLQEKNYDRALLSQIKTSHVEALRYMHLRKSPDSSDKQKHQLLLRQDARWFSNFVILILGDYKLENTITQITMITECLTKLPSSTKFFLKPHPVVTLPKSLLRDIPITITTEPIEDVLPMCDLAITSNVTTASLDAFLKKIPVICVFDPSKLNLSPLKELDSSLFASSSAELLDKIQLVMENAPISFCKPEEVFNLDSSLGMWLNLIKRQIK